MPISLQSPSLLELYCIILLLCIFVSEMYLPIWTFSLLGTVCQCFFFARNNRLKISKYFFLEPEPSLISQHLLLDVLMAMISWFLRYFLVLSLKSRWENEGLVLCLNISSSPLSFYGRSCRAFSFQCFLFFIL